MCKKTDKSTENTSFHDITIFASVQDLIRSFGEPSFQDNMGDDKVNFEWEMETDDGDVFTIYDWKEYRRLNKIEVINWHIGSHSKKVSIDAVNEVQKSLNYLFN
jgi:hypothetical protein